MESGAAVAQRQTVQKLNAADYTIWSTSCPSCDNPFPTRHRVLDHMRDSPRCRQWLLENIPPMSAEELQLVYAANKGVNIAHSRLHIPKSGPKPAGLRPKRNVITPEYADLRNKLAAVPLLD
eukprot:5121202-Amphidinium_carterae.1